MLDFNRMDQTIGQPKSLSYRKTERFPSGSGAPRGCKDNYRCRPLQLHFIMTRLSRVLGRVMVPVPMEICYGRPRLEHAKDIG
jgi:hypothetical protein